MIPARFMHLAVRIIGRVRFGNTDPSLRVLGLYVGLFLLLAFWFASWTMRGGASGRNPRRLECDDRPSGRFASRLRSGVAAGGAHAGSYLAFNLPSKPCSFFLRSGASRP